MFPSPDTQAYKKARRQHLKTTRNRDNSVDSEWTPFRAAEKRYKARFPPPDLSDVLDLGSDSGSLLGRADAVECKELSPMADGSNGKRVCIVPRVPGLVILPSFVSPEGQMDLVRWSLCDQARQPNETNLDTHYILPQEGLWSAYLHSRSHIQEEPIIQPRKSTPSPRQVSPENSGPRKLINNTPATVENIALLSESPKPLPSPSPTVEPATPSILLQKLRWANIGWHYHWGSKQYDFSKGKGTIHMELRNLCKRAVAAVNWEEVFGLDDETQWGDSGPEWKNWNETYEPDAGIVNFYQTKDTLMAHVDRSEVCATSPLVSISLGNAAIFLIGGLARDVEPIAILLRSGDTIIMSGPMCRRAYHGVPRILGNTSPSHFLARDDNTDWVPYAEYIHTARININVRQVFPKGVEIHQNRPDAPHNAVE